MLACPDKVQMESEITHRGQIILLTMSEWGPRHSGPQATSAACAESHPMPSIPCPGGGMWGRLAEVGSITRC